MLSAQSAQIHSAIVSHLDEQKIVLKELVQHSEIHFQLGKPVIQGGKYYGTYLLPVKLSLCAKDALQTLIDRDDSILLPFEEWYELDIYDVQPDGSARVNLCVGDLERNCERTLAELNTARSEMLGMLWDDAKELEKIVLEELGQRAGKFKEDIAVTSTLGDVMQLQPDEQAIAQTELSQYLTQQAQESALEPKGLFSEVTHTIRQLKAEVSKLHKEMGAVVTKAAFKKRAADMTKSLLAKAMNFVQGVLDKAPRTYRWSEVIESRRITTSRADGKIWCTFFGFANEYDANRFYYWLFKKPGRCTMAAVRLSKSTDCPFEVKVWGVDPDVLARAIRKDTPMLDLQDRLKAEGASLRQDIPGHFSVWTTAGQIGTVDQGFDLSQNSWWVNQRQISKLNVVSGDHLRYQTPEEAAVALVQLCRIIAEGDRARLDLFGG